MYKNNKPDEVLTSVYVDRNLCDSFKVFKVMHKISLRQLVEIAMYKFITDADFRVRVQTEKLPSKYNLILKIDDSSTAAVPAIIPETVTNLDPEFLKQPFPTNTGTPEGVVQADSQSTPTPTV